MTRNPAKTEAGLEQALELLKGPSDERRFVGLLLVSKFVAPGNHEHIQQVQKAVGFTFLHRLLMPLRAHRAASPVGDGSQQVAAADMALAVLSTFSSVPALAASPEMQEFVPLLVKVVLNGGIASTMGVDVAADEVASLRQQQDVMETLLGICSGSEQGRRVVLESQGVKAAGLALAQAPTAVQLAVPSLRLLASLCAPGSGAEAEGAELAIALPAAAWCLAAPAHLPAHCPKESSSRAQQPAQNAAPASASLQASISPGRNADGASSGGAAEGSRASSNEKELVHSAAAEAQPPNQPSGRGPEDLGTSDKSDTSLKSIPSSALTDPAAVQLEALRCLLLLLPACLHQADSPDICKASAGAGCWGSLRTGMRLLLVGRAGQAQRHGALQAAALFQQLCATPAWLLGSSGCSTQEDSFFQLLVELLGIEFTILLRDALAPYHAASATSEPITSAVPEDLDLTGHAPSAAGTDMDIQEQLQASPSKPPGSRATTDALADQVAQGLSLKHRLDTEGQSASLPSPETTADQAQAAWQRAQEMVPACCVLYEASVEALAASSGDDADADGSLHTLIPADSISERVAMAALRTLDNAAGTLLQYLEAVAAMPEAHQDPLILAVIRALGRFLADVPSAHATQVKQLWQFMTSVHSGQGEAFLLPYSMQE